MYSIEIPLSLQDFEIASKEYHKSFSSVTLVWSPASFNQSQDLVRQIDHYQLVVETEALNNTVLATYWINSIETMITVSTLPYNSNITLSLTAHNCVGDSQTVTIAYSPSKYNLISLIDTLSCLACSEV